MSLVTYSELSYEISTLKMELEGMSDDALVDECNHIMLNSDSEIMEQIIVSYFKNGKLSESERKVAENLYCLAYLELGWEE